VATIFTRIIEGELPGTFIWKDEQAVAFLSINPLQDGHTLVVPREEVDHWIDAPPELLSHLTGVCRAIGQALARVYEPAKVGQMIAGLEVPHLHIHLVPIWGVHDLDFANAAESVDPDELEANAERIRGALRDLAHDEHVAS
jgi:histidine triad (HIT) family protein